MVSTIRCQRCSAIMCLLSEETAEYKQQVQDRILSRIWINDETGCWELKKAKKTSYPRVRVKGKQYYAHRAMFILLNGSIDDDNVVMHSCDSDVCCNPYHLTQGTQADNVADMVAKGRCKRASGLENGNSLRRSEIDMILRDFYTTDTNISALARRYKRHHATIRNIVNGKTYKDVYDEFKVQFSQRS